MGICCFNQIQCKPTKRGWGIPRTAFPSRRRHGQRPGPAGWRSSWEDAAVSRLALLKFPLPCLQTCPRPRPRLWPLLHRSLSSTEDVSSASVRCEHLGCAQCELDAAGKTTAKVSPLRQEKPNRRLTVLLPLTSTDVNVRLCKLCHRYPALTTACNLSYTSSPKKAASGAFGTGITILGEGSRGGRVPGEGSPSTHCT